MPIGMLSTQTTGPMASADYMCMPVTTVKPDQPSLSISIVSPLNETYTQESIVEICGSVNQDGVNVFVNGTCVPLVNRCFSYQYALALNENIIIITAENSTGETAETVLTVYREITDVHSAEDALWAVAANYDKIQDFAARLTTCDGLMNEPVYGEQWAKIFFKATRDVRIEYYADSSYAEQTSLLVLRDDVLSLQETPAAAVSKTNLAEFGGISTQQFMSVDMQFEPRAFIGEHELTLDAIDQLSSTCTVTAMPRSISAVYSRVVMDINFEKGIIVKMLLYKQEELIEKTEVLSVMFYQDIAFPTALRKTLYYDLGEYTNEIFYNNVAINQGLADGLFVL